MNLEEAQELRNRLTDLETVESALVFYVDGERIYEQYRDYTPAAYDEFDVEIQGSTGHVIQPDVLDILTDKEVGITHSLTDPGTIRTKSNGLTTSIMDQ